MRSIVIHALFRHGPNTKRKELLSRLGCEHANEYNYKSDVFVRFMKEHSTHTPEFTFTSFDKAFKAAKKMIKYNTENGTSGSITTLIENIVKPDLRRHTKTDKQAKRQTTGNEKIKIYDDLAAKAKAKRNQESKAEHQRSVDAAKEEHRKQQDRKRENAAKNIKENP